VRNRRLRGRFLAPQARNPWSLRARLAKSRPGGTLGGLARSPCIPAELTKRPFTLDEARNAGLTLSALRGRAWRRLGSELYCWTELDVDHWSLLSAWRHILPSEAVFAGATAAWLLGLDTQPTQPVEIQIHPGSAFGRALDLTSAGARSHLGTSSPCVDSVQRHHMARLLISVFGGTPWKPWLSSTWRSDQA